MDGATGGDEEGVPQEPTVASILGIRGPLRFRSHGSTQKAHVVLRQIELPEESGDEGDHSSMVYFSLFAQKRIEVKPGKEILLAVASPDGRFIDTPVIFAGSIVEQKVDEKPEIPSDPVVEAVPAKPAVYTMPPRMRKAWPGQTSVGQTGSGFPGEFTRIVINDADSLTHMSDLPPSKSVSYSSVGVQCEIPTRSQAVETEPEPVKPVVSSGVQAVEPPRVKLTKDTQTDVPVLSYKEGAAQTIVQVDPVPVSPVVEIPDPSKSEPAEKITEEERERSLSPMELDSTPSSPTLSPAIVPSNASSDFDERAKSLPYSPRTFSPPELSLSTTDTSQTLAATEARVSPLRLSPDSGDAPGLSITPEVIAFHKTFTPPVDRTNLRLPSPKESIPPQKPQQELQPGAPAAALAQPVGVEPALTRPSLAPFVTPTPPTPVIVPEARALDPPPPQTEPARYVPKRKAVPNPFVSGGYLSDFVSTTTQTSTAPKPTPRPPSPKQPVSQPFNVSQYPRFLL